MAAAVRPDTAVVHVQWGNHEVGTRQPVAEVVAACAELDVLVHVDAAQANGHDPVDFAALGADLAVRQRPQVRRAGRRRARCSCAAACASTRCSSAATRSGPAGPAWRTCRRWRASRAACAALADGRLADEADRARRLTDRVLAGVAEHGRRPDLR